MSDTLQPIGLFATPESVAALQDYVAKFNKQEAVIANTVMGMTWNLCAKLTAPKEVEEDASMYAAFNTIQLELERLIILKESIESSGQAGKESTKLAELEHKILSHEKAVKILIRTNQAEAVQQATG